MIDIDYTISLGAILNTIVIAAGRQRFSNATRPGEYTSTSCTGR